MTQYIRFIYFAIILPILVFFFVKTSFFSYSEFILTALSSLFGIILFYRDVFVTPKKEREKDKTRKEIQDDVKVIKEINETKVSDTEYKVEVLKYLIQNGNVHIEEIYKILSEKEFFLVITYGEGVGNIKKEIENHFNLDKEIINERIPKNNAFVNETLTELGFVKIFHYYTFFINSTKNFPKAYDIFDIEEIIEKTFNKKWDEIKNDLNINFDENVCPKVSYLVIKLPKGHFIINYVNKDSFTKDFKQNYLYLLDRKEIKNLLKRNEKEVIRFFSKISLIDFLDLKSNLTEKLKEKEKEINKKFKIKYFIDYSYLNKEEINKGLKEIFLGEIPENSINLIENEIMSVSKKLKKDLVDDLKLNLRK